MQVDAGENWYEDRWGTWDWSYHKEPAKDPWEQNDPWRDGSNFLQAPHEESRRVAQKLRQEVTRRPTSTTARGKASMAASSTDPQANPYEAKEGQWKTNEGGWSGSSWRPKEQDAAVGESARVVPETEIGETLVIGKFKGRTRTTTANTEAMKALDITGCRADMKYILGAPSTSTVVKAKMATWQSATRALAAFRQHMIGSPFADTDDGRLWALRMKSPADVARTAPVARAHRKVREQLDDWQSKGWRPNYKLEAFYNVRRLGVRAEAAVPQRERGLGGLGGHIRDHGAAERRLGLFGRMSLKTEPRRAVTTLSSSPKCGAKPGRGLKRLRLLHLHAIVWCG